MTDERAAQDSPAITAYGEVCRSLERIEDFRGKLLAALPLVSGAGGILLLRGANSDNISNSIDRGFVVGAAILGVIVTIGLLFFELRGIQRCIRLAKVGTALELQMDVDGQFRLMPHSVLRFINEPYASAFVYSAVFAGWSFVAIAALLSEPADFPGFGATVWAAVVSGIFFLISFLGVRWFYYHVREDDRDVDKVREVDVATGTNFVADVQEYAGKLARLLSEPPWTLRKPTSWGWARSDPELRKILQRLFGLTDELLRVCCITPSKDVSDRDRLSKEVQRRVLDLIGTEPSELRLDSGLEVFDALDRLLLEFGDARYVCAEVETELLINRGTTTYVRWRDLFGDVKPAVLDIYYKGSMPHRDELEAARSMLASLRRVRADDYQVHRARQRMRARNLHVLSALLVPVVALLGWFIVHASDVRATQVGLVAVSGAMGAIIAGTLKARDRLVRGSDLRAFRSGIAGQVLVGAGSALFFLLVLETGVVEFGDVDAWAGQAVGGFVAGFSEPFLLRTVERVAKLGTDDTAPFVPSTRAGMASPTTSVSPPSGR